MTEVLRPMLELSVVLPEVLLAYFPMKAYLKYPARQCLMWMAPALVMLTMAGGVLCQRRGIPTAPVLWPLALAATAAYIKSLRISVWKSGTVALTVCAVFACIKSISRGIDAAILMNAHGVNSTPWLCLGRGCATISFAGCLWRRPTIPRPTACGKWWRMRILPRPGMSSGCCPWGLSR